MNIESEKESSDVASIPFLWQRISRKLLTLGVETRGEHLTYIVTHLPFEIAFFPGIQLVPLDERTDKPYSKIFFIWFSMNVNILSYVVEFWVRDYFVELFSGSLLGHWAQ
jgi:hypothetical protein